MGYQHLNRTVFTSMLILLLSGIQAQYYYNDLFSIKQLEAKQNSYQANRVKQVNETALLTGGQKQPDYQQWTRISIHADTFWQQKNKEQLTITTCLVFEKNGKLKGVIENQPDLRNNTIYERSASGSVSIIETDFFDSTMDFRDHEIHRWFYNEKGMPQVMWRLAEQFDGRMDTTEIRFTLDSAGRVAEERSYRKGKETGFFYYYYNESGQLTDIVRYNDKWNRLLPDLMFEYDEQGNLIQKMQLTSSRDMTYLIWRYGYDKKRLMYEEALFNEKKEHTGSIRYSYEYY